jgi:hypothetical protein
MSLIKSIEGLILKRIGFTTRLKQGKYKRELYMDHGHQKYVIDEIVENPNQFTDMEIGYPYDMTVYINGLEKNTGERMIRFCIKTVKQTKGYSDFTPLAKNVMVAILLIGISFSAPAQSTGIFDFLKKEKTGKQHVAKQGKNKFKGYHKMKFTKSQLSGITYKKGGK